MSKDIKEKIYAIIIVMIALVVASFVFSYDFDMNVSGDIIRETRNNPTDVFRPVKIVSSPIFYINGQEVMKQRSNISDGGKYIYYISCVPETDACGGVLVDKSTEQEISIQSFDNVAFFEEKYLVGYVGLPHLGVEKTGVYIFLLEDRDSFSSIRSYDEFLVFDGFGYCNSEVSSDCKRADFESIALEPEGVYVILKYWSDETRKNSIFREFYNIETREVEVIEEF